MPFSPPSVPQSGSTPPFVCLLSAAFVTSVCVFGTPADACMNLPSLFLTRRAPLNQYIHYHFIPHQGFFFPFEPLYALLRLLVQLSLCASLRTQHGSMFYGTKDDGPDGTTPSGLTRLDFRLRMACKPGSVPRHPNGRREDDHSSGTAVAHGLLRSTRTTGRRRPWASHPVVPI